MVTLKSFMWCVYILRKHGTFAFVRESNEAIKRLNTFSSSSLFFSISLFVTEMENISESQFLCKMRASYICMTVAPQNTGWIKLHALHLTVIKDNTTKIQFIHKIAKVNCKAIIKYQLYRSENRQSQMLLLVYFSFDCDRNGRAEKAVSFQRIFPSALKLLFCFNFERQCVAGTIMSE